MFFKMKLFLLFLGIPLAVTRSAADLNDSEHEGINTHLLEDVKNLHKYHQAHIDIESNEDAIKNSDSGKKNDLKNMDIMKNMNKKVQTIYEENLKSQNGFLKQSNNTVSPQLSHGNTLNSEENDMETSRNKTHRAGNNIEKFKLYDNHQTKPSKKTEHLHSSEHNDHSSNYNRNDQSHDKEEQKISDDKEEIFVEKDLKNKANIKTQPTSEFSKINSSIHEHLSEKLKMTTKKSKVTGKVEEQEKEEEDGKGEQEKEDKERMEEDNYFENLKEHNKQRSDAKEQIPEPTEHTQKKTKGVDERKEDEENLKKETNYLNVKNDLIHGSHTQRSGDDLKGRLAVSQHEIPKETMKTESVKVNENNNMPTGKTRHGSIKPDTSIIRDYRTTTQSIGGRVLKGPMSNNPNENESESDSSNKSNRKDIIETAKVNKFTKTTPKKPVSPVKTRRLINSPTETPKQVTPAERKYFKDSTVKKHQKDHLVTKGTVGDNKIQSHHEHVSNKKVTEGIVGGNAEKSHKTMKATQQSVTLHAIVSTTNTTKETLREKILLSFSSKNSGNFGKHGNSVADRNTDPNDKPKKTLTHIKQKSTSIFKDLDQTHRGHQNNLAEQSFGDGPSEDPCKGRFDPSKQYTGSAVVAAAVGGVFIGAFAVFLLFHLRQKCKKYVNGDYRRVPMEYDFELNPRFKTH